MELGLGVREGRSINKKQKKKRKKIETPNKHSFNKPSTKKNTQNYCFLRYYNAVIYENGTRRLFKSSKLSMIESILIVAAMSLSMNNIIASGKNSSFNVCVQYGSWLFHNLQIKYNFKLLCYYMVNNLQSLNTIDKYYAHKHSTTNQ